MPNISRSRKAFTLIELLVVVLILGVLAAVAIPSYLSSVQTAKDNAAHSNAQTLANVIQADYVKHVYSNYNSYSALTGLTGTMLSDIGGTVPTNPCNTLNTIAASGTSTGYTITELADTTGLTVTANGCSTPTIAQVQLGS